MIGQTCVLVTPYKPVVHGLITRAFSLQTRKRHELPLFNEKVTSIFACLADVLQLITHEFSLRVADAFGKGALDVDGEPLGAF